VERDPEVANLEDWLCSSPDLGDIVLMRRDDRKGKPKETAIIIPSYRDQKMLHEHLARLSLQTAKDFDIIIVYGEGDGFISPPSWSSILHLRCMDLGSAGAFYAGERCALEEGYRKIILADDDCLPESRNLVESIILGLDSQAATKPWIRHHPFPGPHRSVIYHYGGLRREALEGSGLTFLPMRRGFDDFELESRLKKAGIDFTMVDSEASHPWYVPFVLLGRESRNLHYFGRGSIFACYLGKDWVGAYGAFFFRLMKALCCHAIGREDLRDSYLEAARQESTGALDGGGHGIEGRSLAKKAGHPGQSDIVIRQIGLDGVANGRPGGRKDTLSSKASNLLEIPGFFNKRIIFMESCIDWDLRMMVFAKSCFLEQGQETYQVSKERGPASIALGAIALLICVPFMAAYSAFLTARGGWEFRSRGITSEGYGLPLKDDGSHRASNP
jgi:hypothetical protein